MGNQPSSEIKADPDGDGDGVDNNVLHNPTLSPLYRHRSPSDQSLHSQQPHSPNFSFSSQVPPSADRQIPPVPSVTSLGQDIKIEIPESPDRNPQRQPALHDKPTKSKKRKLKNRPSLISQPRDFIDSNASAPTFGDQAEFTPSNADAVPSSELGANGTPTIGNTPSQGSILKHRKRGRKHQKKAARHATEESQGSIDLGNTPGEPTNLEFEDSLPSHVKSRPTSHTDLNVIHTNSYKPSEKSSTKKKSKKMNMGSLELEELHERPATPSPISNSPNRSEKSIKFTPLDTLSSKKQKVASSNGQSKKKRKHAHDQEDSIAGSVTSFSGLAKSLYVGRKKRKTDKTREDASLDVVTRAHKYTPRNSSPSPDASNGTDPEQLTHPNALSDNEMEIDESPQVSLSSEDDTRLRSKHHRVDLDTSSSGGNDSSSDNGQADAQDQMDVDEDDESRSLANQAVGSNNEDKDGDYRDGPRSGSSPEVASSDADSPGDEYHPNAPEPPPSPDGSPNSDAAIPPKSGSTKKRRFAKPSFYDRKIEESPNGINSRTPGSTTSTTGPSKSAGKKRQPKISSMLKGDAEDHAESEASPSKQQIAPRKTQQHELITGQFSEFELRNITQAVERWRDDHNLTQHEINDLIQGDPREVKSGEFWARIAATCPNRRRQKVINQCRRKFHNFVARGTWTQEQQDELKQMWELHGNKYAKIGKLINRHPEDVRDRIRNYVVCGESRRVDLWNQEDEDKLKSIVDNALAEIRQWRNREQTQTHEPDESLVDWQKVSECMDRTRSRLQCIQKWKSITRQKNGGTSVSIDGGEALPIDQLIQKARDEAMAISHQDRYRIVKAIRAYGTNADSRIPWAKVRAKHLANRWPRPTLMLLWYRLRLFVPDSNILSIPEVIHQLTTTYHQTHELNFPDDEDLDLDAESREIEHKISKILKSHHTPKTPSIVKADDEDDELVSDNESSEDDIKYDDETASGNEDDIDDKDNDEQDNQHDEESSEGNESASDQAEDEVSMIGDGTGQDSAGSVELGHDIEDKSRSRESSVGAPSISDFKTPKVQRGQKKYGSLNRVMKSGNSTPDKLKMTSKKHPHELSEDEIEDPDDDLSSDTNASEVESIPARL
ncbi:hypothetical protein AAE478_010266 [Parahypoxylon ruwenzoriense]